MKLFDDEHYKIMLQFEKDFSSIRLDKEKNKDLWKIGQVYESGETNQLFLAYRRGYSFSKFINGGNHE